MKVTVTPGVRGWLHVTVEPDDDATYRRVAKSVQDALGDRARWVAYDGESSEITVCLVRDGDESSIFSEALARLAHLTGET